MGYLIDFFPAGPIRTEGIVHGRDCALRTIQQFAGGGDVELQLEIELELEAMQSQADDATSCTEPAFTFMSDLQRSASQARAPGLDPAIDGKSSTLRQRSLWVSCFGQCVSCWQARQGADSPQKPPRRGAEARQEEGAWRHDHGRRYLLMPL